MIYDAANLTPLPLNQPAQTEPAIPLYRPSHPSTAAPERRHEHRPETAESISDRSRAHAARRRNFGLNRAQRAAAALDAAVRQHLLRTLGRRGERSGNSAQDHANARKRVTAYRAALAARLLARAERHRARALADHRGIPARTAQRAARQHIATARAAETLAHRLDPTLADRSPV